MAATNGSAPKITLYTNHRCPFAHRAHIAIKELGLPYEEVIIDLDKPREPWYLEVNPRGLVPAIKISADGFSDEIITESGIVSQFLADAYPSPLLPASGDPKSALARARINFFADTWATKAQSKWFQVWVKEDADEQAELAKNFVDIVTKEVEPLLKDAAPFFGGSEKLTLAEALVAPFILRIYAESKNNAAPAFVAEKLDTLPNFSKWAAAVTKHDSVTYIWDEKAVLEGRLKKLASLRAQKK